MYFQCNPVSIALSVNMASCSDTIGMHYDISVKTCMLIYCQQTPIITAYWFPYVLICDNRKMY